MKLPSLLVLLLIATGGLRAEPKPEPLYETRLEHDPNGIGKFFMNREIAQVMGHQAWPWLERPEREEEEGTERLIAALHLKTGDAVADIGAGSGFFSWRMAKLVGDKGKIYAVEIQQEMLDLLMKNMSQRRVASTVVPILGTITDPQLPAASCDLMLMVDVYHEFDHPYEMVAAMIPALKPGGRIAFVEFRKEDPKVSIKLLHKMSEAQVKLEMSVHPNLEFQEIIETLPQQHIIIFQKK